MSRYVVRAYDVRAGRLLPRRIADRSQPGWVMEGQPVRRTTSTDGRWVYTLYMNGDGYPFVHALDTVGATAHCIGPPWPQGRNQGALSLMSLRLADGDRTLALARPNGTPFVRIDTRTWRLEHASGGFPWWTLWLALGLLSLAAAAVWGGRRRARPTGTRPWPSCASLRRTSSAAPRSTARG